jgi:hypothetical protein
MSMFLRSLVELFTYMDFMSFPLDTFKKLAEGLNGVLYLTKMNFYIIHTPHNSCSV